MQLEIHSDDVCIRLKDIFSAQLVTRPDVVEMHDVTAKDPRLLVHLKVNSVCVCVCVCTSR